ncbi:hypothetical protein ACQEU8_36645 [Streptomyces sp. CA-250714]|uniref:hypothetical protein n=1 Tax=Streptomyces sp. CA-250714 TaxID=3240060 RepID=UPI003D8EBFF7
MATKFVAHHDGQTFTRTSKTRTYTHVVIAASTTGNGTFAYRWSGSEVNARKGASEAEKRGFKVAAVIPCAPEGQEQEASERTDDTPRTGRTVTIPGALADHLAAQYIGDDETAAALDAARRGRGRTLVIEPTSTRPLHIISRHAEHILSIRGAYSRAQIAAARLWIKRAGHAPAILTHRFETTGKAYDASQNRDDIRDGDVLVIESEQVVAILYRAWPAAVTTERGELHSVDGDPRTLDDGKYTASVEAAERIAREHGYALPADRQPDPVEAPVIVRADEVRPGDTVLACFGDDLTADTATEPHALYHAEPYTAAPAPYNPACGCTACAIYKDHEGPIVNLAIDTPWETCDPAPAEAPTLIRRATVDTELADTVAAVEQADAAAGTWRGEWIGEQQADDALFTVEQDAEQGALFAPGVRTEQAAERRVVEGVIVEHDGTAEGSLPADSTHPNVRAARAALDGLKAARLTDHHDVTEPTEAETDVRGYMVDPREGDRVAVYWLEGGRIIRRDQMPHGPALDCLADRLRRRGWTVETMLRSSQCVFAHRPQ